MEKDTRKYPEQTDDMAKKRKKGKEKASKDIINDFIALNKIDINKYPDISVILQMTSNEFIDAHISINKIKIMLFDIVLPKYKNINPVKYFAD